MRDERTAKLKSALKRLAKTPGQFGAATFAEALVRNKDLSDALARDDLVAALNSMSAVAYMAFGGNDYPKGVRSFLEAHGAKVPE